MKYVYCISGLGQAFIGALIDPDVGGGNEYRSPETLAGLNKYALVYDIEYNGFYIQKWGYDCFTFADAQRRGNSPRQLKNQIKLKEEYF